MVGYRIRYPFYDDGDGTRRAVSCVTQHEDGATVEIGLREIYDKVLETHGAVQLYGPRLDAVEKKADKALMTATDADIRSQENRKQLSLLWKVLGTVGSGAALSFIGDLISRHIF